ncbi:hypothetical protein D3C72_1399910 [compost metagenome]
MARIGHQEHGLYVAVEALVHRRHLELVFEVRDRAQAAHDDVGVHFLGEMHQQAAERPHLDVGVEARHLGLQHLDPLGGREQRALVVVLGHADDQPVDQFDRPPDDVHVAVRDRVESPRIQSDAHGLGLPAFRPV